MSTKKPQFSIVIDDELLTAVNNYQATYHIKSRSKAINQLIALGVKAASSSFVSHNRDLDPRDASTLLLHFSLLSREQQREFLKSAFGNFFE